MVVNNRINGSPVSPRRAEAADTGASLLVAAAPPTARSCAACSFTLDFPLCRAITLGFQLSYNSIQR